MLMIGNACSEHVGDENGARDQKVRENEELKLKVHGNGGHDSNGKGTRGINPNTDIFTLIKRNIDHLQNLDQKTDRIYDRMEHIVSAMEKIMEHNKKTEESVYSLVQHAVKTDIHLQNAQEDIRRLAEGSRTAEKKIEDVMKHAVRTDKQIKSNAQKMTVMTSKIDDIQKQNNRTYQKVNELIVHGKNVDIEVKSNAKEIANISTIVKEIAGQHISSTLKEISRNVIEVKGALTDGKSTNLKTPVPLTLTEGNSFSNIPDFAYPDWFSAPG